MADKTLTSTASTFATAPADVRNTLNTQLNEDDFDGCIDEYSEDPISVAKSLLPFATTFSVAPLSNFNVGAIAIGASGRLFFGANMEFIGVPISTSLHAEQSALLNAWIHGEKAIKALVISEAPCGHCRQFLFELSNASSINVHFGTYTKLLTELLPLNFGFERSSGNDLLDSQTTPLEAVEENLSKLKGEAAMAARLSYAPYTLSNEGFALESTDGRIHTGRVAESAAFNPSVPAIVSALNQKNLSSSRQYPLSYCVHAHLPTAQSSHRKLSIAIIRHISNVKIQNVLLKPE